VKNFFKASGLILLYMGVYFVLQIIVTLIISFGYMLMQTFNYVLNTTLNDAEIDSEQFIKNIVSTIIGYTPLFIIMSAIGAFFFYILISKIRKKNLFELCEFNKISVIEVIDTLLLGISSNVLTIVFISFLPIEKLTPEYEELMESINGGNFIITLLGVGIAGPFIEEVVFRGLIYNELKRHMRIMPAVVIQALLFGIYHLNVVQGIYAFLLGIILALALNWTGTIWSSILIHFSFNTFNIAISYFADESYLESTEGTITTAISVLASIVIFGLCTFVLWVNRKSKKQVKEQNNAIIL